MANKEEGYNGYTNYETWNCKLWMDNDQGEYEYIKETAKDIVKKAKKTDVWIKEDSAKFGIADFIKSHVEENTPDIKGMYSDILNAALSEINYREIAEMILDEIKE
jgi:cytochrome b involved in lipid metabolism